MNDWKRDMDHDWAREQYRFWKKHGRPDGPYHLVCTGCEDHWEVDDPLLDADHDARRHAGEHGGLYGEHAEIAITDNYGRELYRIHSLPHDDGHPLFVTPKCESCGAEMAGVSCGQCGHIPEENRA